MSGRDTQLLAWLIGMPALVCAVGLPLFESSEAARPPAMAATFVEALADRNVEHAYVFIRQGHDPNALIRFRDDVRTGGEEVQVSPLMLAVAGSDDNTAAMLLSFGARTDDVRNRHVACLARDMGMAGFVDLQLGTGSDADCPAPTGAEHPLLAYVD